MFLLFLRKLKSTLSLSVKLSHSQFLQLDTFPTLIYSMLVKMKSYSTGSFGVEDLESFTGEKSNCRQLLHCLPCRTDSSCCGLTPTSTSRCRFQKLVHNNARPLC
ncbi:unnamed protein product [Amoebophrya sp. A25]|nr:unnamed protein product [Amoebophrya sp. A25]|eukprot:GSA25T00000216001.1